MPRSPKSPLTAIIAFAMSAPIDQVKQGIDTLKTIVKEREAAGLKEPALPLKKAKPRARKPRAVAAGVQVGTAAGQPEAAAPAPVTGRVQAEAAARSPRRRPPVGGTAAPAAPATAATSSLPDQTVDESHVE